MSAPPSQNEETVPLHGPVCALRPLAIGLALLAMSFAGCQGPRAGYQPDDPSVARIPLRRSYENKLLFRATVPGGHAWMMLDTGAPITVVDKSRSALFHFKPFPEGANPPTVILNGQQARMALIPQMKFGGVTETDSPVALVDISRMNRASDCDAILGLGDMRRSHAVIDFGSRALFLHPGSARGKIPAGWRAVPMSFLGDHLVVPVAVNGAQTFFVVDSGAPATMIDTSLGRSLRIPVKKQYSFTVSAINYQTQAARLGLVRRLSIGDIDIGPALVAVIDLSKLIGPQLNAINVTGLIGSQTLARHKAIIDCDAMQLYLKQP